MEERKQYMYVQESPNHHPSRSGAATFHCGYPHRASISCLTAQWRHYWIILWLFHFILISYITTYKFKNTYTHSERNDWIWFKKLASHYLSCLGTKPPWAKFLAWQHSRIYNFTPAKVCSQCFADSYLQGREQPDRGATWMVGCGGGEGSARRRGECGSPLFFSLLQEGSLLAPVSLYSVSCSSMKGIQGT